ncbi:ATP-binding protein [Sphingomonas sp. CLY1604]|uniref:ATP-binding protein n=1 Tax=Sphingomonas sp. CLY1604 TaxID=3457786 RepID=UPI003FD880A4
MDQRFALLVKAVKDYAIYLLDPEGHVASWNAGAERFKGYTADEIIGQHFSRFYTEEDRQAGEPARALHIAESEGKYDIEGWRMRKDGTRFRASVLIDPIRDDAGRLIGFAKVTRDLTERWLAQQEVERAREAMAQAQKMEAVGRLTGGVAHDFNNLLTIIRSSVDLLRRPGLDPAKHDRYIDAIADTADRAAALTAQLLAFARRQPLKPEVFDIAERLAAMRPIIETSTGPAIRLTIEAAAPALVYADFNQFETALLNLVVNARDAMPAGGGLRVACRPADGVPAVRGHGAASGRFAAVTVTDEGGGIDPQTMRHIFEPFFTTKGLHKGTGLGLSQVHGFAKQSGGEIDVDSAIGQGTTFTLFLPLADGGLAQRAARRKRPDANPGTRRILLVEDNEAVGAFARELFEEMGQIVTWVQNGEAAVALLEVAAAKFDLIFTDVIMPGMSGLDLARLATERWPQIRVVLTSGYSDALAEDGDHGFDFVRKPYSVEGIVAVLGNTPDTAHPAAARDIEAI